MKIQFASDIHLELSDNSRFIKSEPFEATGDVLVFAVILVTFAIERCQI